MGGLIWIWDGMGLAVGNGLIGLPVDLFLGLGGLGLVFIYLEEFWEMRNGYGKVLGFMFGLDLINCFEFCRDWIRGFGLL